MKWILGSWTEVYNLQYTGARDVTTEFNRWDKSKQCMNSVLGNQSLPPSITQCAWYWLTPKTLTSQLTAASEWVSEHGRLLPSPLSAHFFFLCLTFLVSVWAVTVLGLWMPARPTVVRCMLEFGLATCWDLLCLCSTGKHFYCCSYSLSGTTQRHTPQWHKEPDLWQRRRWCWKIWHCGVFYTMRCGINRLGM